MRDEEREVAIGVYSFEKLNYKEKWRWGNIELRGGVCLRSERLEHVCVIIGRSQSQKRRRRYQKGAS